MERFVSAQQRCVSNVFVYTGKKREERAGFRAKSEQFVRRVSSTTIGRLRNRSTGDLLLLTSVNSGKQRAALARWVCQSMWESSGRCERISLICSHLPPVFFSGRAKSFCSSPCEIYNRRAPRFAPGAMFLRRPMVVLLALRTNCSCFASKSAKYSCLLPDQFGSFWMVIAREPFDRMSLNDRIVRSRFDQSKSRTGGAASGGGDSR
jgi:hypothetical protein